MVDPTNGYTAVVTGGASSTGPGSTSRATVQRERVREVIAAVPRTLEGRVHHLGGSAQPAMESRW